VCEKVASEAALAIAKVWWKAMGVNRGGCFVSPRGDSPRARHGIDKRQAKQGENTHRQDKNAGNRPCQILLFSIIKKITIHISCRKALWD